MRMWGGDENLYNNFILVDLHPHDSTSEKSDYVIINQPSNLHNL